MSEGSSTLSRKTILYNDIQDLSGGRKMLLHQGVARSLGWGWRWELQSWQPNPPHNRYQNQRNSWILQMAVGNAHREGMLF